MTHSVERFDPDRHGDEFAGWCRAWGLPEDSLERLPEIGLIVPGVACAFLIRTDTTVCQIDPLVAAPNADPAVRDRVVDGIVMAIFDIAAKLGYREIGALTAVDAVVERAERHGFTFSERNWRYGLKPLA